MNKIKTPYLLRAIVLGLTVFLTLTYATVTDSAFNGFTVKISLSVQAPPDRVYKTLVHNIGDWWDSDHTFSGDAHNLTIEEKPMGCFCEKLPNAGAARHMEVVNFAPGKGLVMTGGLGPLQSLATTGSMTIQLAPAGDGTKLDVTYAIGGYLDGGLNQLAAPVDGVLTQQFTRLKNYVEHGDPKAK
jgi:uncharacterized protein YndB with AHSA1/START domain